MDTFYLLLLIPVVVAIVAKWRFAHSIAWTEFALQIIVSAGILGAVWWAGLYSQTADTEIWNGEVTAKVREHDSYIESYPCNCTTDSEGNTSCQICFETHYTVDWFLRTTVGNIRLHYLDRTSRSVYNTPDPDRYTAAYVGEPCSVEMPYTNYIKAVPESLFSMVTDGSLEQFASLIPAYPQVHSYYKVNRVLAMGVPAPVGEWNDYLNEYQKKLGNSKEANIIVVLVNTADQLYRHALEQAWLGGKKNDIIVMIGSTNYPQIDWVDTITLGQNAGNSLMTVTMRDDLTALGSIENYTAVIDTMAGIIADKFDRKSMEDYEYLKSEIDPPVWVVVFAFILSIALSIGLTVFFHHSDYFGGEGRSFRRYR